MYTLRYTVCILECILNVYCKVYSAYTLPPLWLYPGGAVGKEQTELPLDCGGMGRQDGEEEAGGGFDEGVGEVVVGMVEFGLVLAAADAEHGALITEEVLGEVLAPAEGLVFKLKIES